MEPVYGEAASYIFLITYFKIIEIDEIAHVLNNYLGFKSEKYIFMIYFTLIYLISFEILRF